jgi:hypothetical protein
MKMVPRTATSAVSFQQSPPGRWESFYILIALLLVTQALEPLLLIGSSSDEALGDSNPTTMLSALAVYAVALVLLARKPSPVIDTIKDNTLLIAVFALPVISIVWSVDHGTTFRRAVALVMYGLFCI